MIKGYIEKNNIQAAIFDMDGLMFDTERIHVETWLPAAKHFGYDVTEDVVIGAIGITRASGKLHFEKAYGKDFPFDDITSFRLVLASERIKENGIPIKPGLNQLLDYLKDNNIKIALGTSTERKRTEWYLDLAGLTSYFNAIVCGDDIKNSKPDPEIFLKAAGLVNTKPEYCIVFEDSFNGIRAAYAAKMHAIMVPDYLMPTAEIKQQCKLIVKTLCD